MKRFAILLALLPAPAIAGPNLDRARAANAAWETCVVSAARRMAGKAGAEAVAEAAFGKCQGEEGTFRRALSEWSRPMGVGAPMPPHELDRQMDVERKSIRAKAFAAILDG